MAWQKLDSTTLGSAGDDINSGTFTVKKFIQIMSHTFGVTGNSRHWTRLGNGSIDTTGTYAQRYSDNGGADNLNTSLNLGMGAGNLALNTDIFSVRYIINISTEEKLAIIFNCLRNTAGAGTAPSRTESVGKWANTSNQFNLHQLHNDEAGNFDVNSNSILIGTD